MEPILLEFSITIPVWLQVIFWNVFDINVYTVSSYCTGAAFIIACQLRHVQVNSTYSKVYLKLKYPKIRFALSLTVVIIASFCIWWFIVAQTTKTNFRYRQSWLKGYWAKKKKQSGRDVFLREHNELRQNAFKDDL